MKRIAFVLTMILLLSMTVSAQWVSDKQENLLTGETTFYTASVAEISQGTLSDATILIRWLPGNELEAFVSWGGYGVMDKAPTYIRYGSEKVIDLPIECLSSDKEAQFLLYPDRFLKKIRSMNPDDTFVIQSVRAVGYTNTVARWKVGNIDAILKASGR
jgi:hypothetical protein